MTLIIPEGYAQVNFVFSGVAAPLGAEVTLGLENAGLFDANEVAEGVHLVWSGNLLAFQTDGISLIEARAKLGPNATGQQGIFVDTTTGGDEGEAGAPNTAVLIHKNTPFGGRAGRGRMFMPGVRESRYGPGGELSGDYLTGIATALDTFYEELTTQDLLPVVLHSESSPLEGPSTITSFTADPKVATQRRRLR